MKSLRGVLVFEWAAKIHSGSFLFGFEGNEIEKCEHQVLGVFCS